MQQACIPQYGQAAVSHDACIVDAFHSIVPRKQVTRPLGSSLSPALPWRQLYLGDCYELLSMTLSHFACKVFPVLKGDAYNCIIWTTRFLAARMLQCRYAI